MVATVMTNRIYFAQHGLAVNKEEDANRPLSAAGIEQTTRIAKQLSISKIPVSDIYHSGKLRAQQTAEIYATALNIPSLLISNHLSPNDDVKQFAEKLKFNHALYVGHLPHLEILCTYLVTGRETPTVLSFKNSAIVCLQENAEVYTVQWYLTPEIIS